MFSIARPPYFTVGLNAFIERKRSHEPGTLHVTDPPPAPLPTCHRRRHSRSSIRHRYGRTQPLLEPQHLGSTLSALGLSGVFRQRWKGLRIAELGAQLLGSANRLALRHPHRFAQPATAADRARILEALPGIEKPGPDSASGCKTWDCEG